MTFSHRAIDSVGMLGANAVAEEQLTVVRPKKDVRETSAPARAVVRRPKGKANAQKEIVSQRGLSAAS